MSDEARFDLLHEMQDALALQLVAHEALTAIMWRAASFFNETGTPVPLLAEALGVSEPTFYRKQAAVRRRAGG